MTVNEPPIADAEHDGTAPLELLTDDEGLWTAVPIDASGDERMSEWISVEAETLCDLEEWR